MKNSIPKLSVLFLFLISVNFSFGQFGVNGPKRKVASYCYGDHLVEDDYEKLKNSTVYFLCPKDIDKDELQSMLQEVWKYSKIEVIKYTKLENYVTKSNSAFLSINTGRNEDVVYLYLDLWMVKDINKSYDAYGNEINFARINLYYDCKLFEILWQSGYKGLNNYIYTKADIKNFKSSIISNYLKSIQKFLNEKKLHDCKQNTQNVEALKKLKNDTLYITENITSKISEGRKDYGCETDEKIDITKKMSKYKFPYKLISFEELDWKIENNEDFYYAICLRPNAYQKEVGIFRSKTGECISYETYPYKQFTDFFRVISYIVGSP